MHDENTTFYRGHRRNNDKQAQNIWLIENLLEPVVFTIK